ncbi:MAG: DUF72 domain-containing protein [Chloroflexi bacterium]|nr:DUF72 domain-containing protein [Chloroflexota bacterium]
MSPKYYVGTSGWHYDHWRGRFYPESLAKAKWLEFYATHLGTVELNNSFYRLPSEAAFAAWRDSSPDDFTFAIKVSRFITHIKRLRNVEKPVDNFIARASILGDKLGPLLYQLPPNMSRSDEALESFLSSLPPRMEHAFEFRHQSWLEQGVFDILRKYNAGLCVFDMPGVSCPLLATADFAYIRFHGSTGLYSSCYPDQELAEWAERLVAVATSLKAVYIYFNNDAEAFAVRNALTLRDYLQRGAATGAEAFGGSYPDRLQEGQGGQS